MPPPETDLRDAANIPRLTLCLGLNSSGSTWLYNVVAALMKIADPGIPEAGGDGGVAQIYADDFTSIDPGLEHASHLVIKTHLPSPGLRFLAAFLQAPTIVTIRDPRDAVTSFMNRFGLSFEQALGAIEKGAARIVAFREGTKTLVLRYEDRFFDREATIVSIAEFLRLTPDQSACHLIYQSLTRESVEKTIETLSEQGVFKPGVAAGSTWDPVTHWHPRHIGKVAAGQYAQTLSPEQQSRVQEATEAFCRHFGYPTKTYALGETISFKSGSSVGRLLTSGWSHLEPRQIWAVDKVSTLELDVAMLTTNSKPIFLRLDLQPFLALGKLPFQRLSILVNGRKIFKGKVKSAGFLDVAVPTELLGRRSPVRIAFIHPDGAAPCEILPQMKDKRVLSFALRSMALMHPAEIV